MAELEDNDSAGMERGAAPSDGAGMERRPGPADSAGVEPDPSDAAPLGVETRPDAPGGPVIEVSGDLDISSVDQLSSAVSEMAAARPEELTFEMSRLRFMDSAGIAVLLGAAGQVPTVRLCNPTTAVRRVIELTGLTEILRVEP
jgi:anti-sigma B factor antagonist